MNILLVTETYLPFVAGVSSSSDSIARYMVSRGHRVVLVNPKPVIKGKVDIIFVKNESCEDCFDVETSNSSGFKGVKC